MSDNSKRKNTTLFLSELLISQKFSRGMGKYWASEVTLDYMHGKGKEKRVDFMQFVPENQLTVSGLEHGNFICYEVKSCKADFKSGNGLNFEGDKNYIVTTMETYRQIVNEIPFNIGVLVAKPRCRKDIDEYAEPTPIPEYEDNNSLGG